MKSVSDPEMRVTHQRLTTAFTPTWVCPLTTTSSAKRTLTGLLLRRALFSADMMDDLGFCNEKAHTGSIMRGCAVDQDTHTLVEAQTSATTQLIQQTLRHSCNQTHMLTLAQHNLKAMWRQLILSEDVGLQSHAWETHREPVQYLNEGWYHECVLRGGHQCLFVLTVMCRRIVTLIQSSKSLHREKKHTHMNRSAKTNKHAHRDHYPSVCCQVNTFSSNLCS